MFFGGLARMSSQRNLRCFPAHLMCCLPPKLLFLRVVALESDKGPCF